eukprot:gene3549-4052_t
MAGISPLGDELDGYLSDLTALFEKFDEKGSLRFEDFCEVWKSMNFSFIHSGKRTLSDQIKATMRLMRCITGFFHPETEFQYRIAALYTAYSVYYTQLSIPRVKIRMTVTMWKDLKDLHKLVKRYQHLDIDYIITKLENDQAFHFTAMPKLLEYGKKELMTNMDSYGSEVSTERKSYQPDQYVEDLVQGLDVIEKVSQVDDEYKAAKEEVKKSLGSSIEPRLLSSLNVTNDDFRSELVRDIEEFRDWLESNTREQVLFDGSERPVTQAVRLTKRKYNNTIQPMEYQRISRFFVSSNNETLDKTSRSERIKAIKTKSFSKAVEGYKKAGTDTSEESSAKTSKSKASTYYRRSAIIEVLEARPWKANWKSIIAKKAPHRRANVS